MSIKWELNTERGRRCYSRRREYTDKYVCHPDMRDIFCCRSRLIEVKKTEPLLGFSKYMVTKVGQQLKYIIMNNMLTVLVCVCVCAKGMCIVHMSLFSCLPIQMK